MQVLWILATAAAAYCGLAWLAALLGVSGLWLLAPQATANAAAAAPPPTRSDGAPGAPPATWQPQALAATLAALAEGVVVLDRLDRVLAANEPAAELLGLGQPRREPPALAEVVDWPQLVAELQQCRRERSARDFEADRAHGTGTRSLAVSVAVVGDGELAVVVLRDQSRLRQLESHRRDFVANVSHELKTPLAAIQGYVETLLDAPDVPPATAQRFLQRVQKQVERLSTLVADLLTLSRLDEQRVPEPAEPCEWGAVAREVARDLQPLADRQGVRLGTDLPVAPVWVAAEREALRQVVSNLVDNAIKYTPAGGEVTVRLSAQKLRAELEVVDTGIGLSEADQERVFERFYRVDRARSRELGGTGLGLSIVKNTVQVLGGEIGVRSRLGAGSTFWVRLPVAPS